MHIFTTIKFNFITLILGMGITLVIGYAIGYFLRKLFTEYQIKEAEARRQKIIREAEKEAENRLKSAEIEAREKSLAVKSDFEKEIKTKRDSFRDQEKDLEQKERKFSDEFGKFKTREKEIEAEFLLMSVTLCSIGFARTPAAVSIPVATTETLILPSRLSSNVEPKMILAFSSTSSRILFAASSTSKRVISLPAVILISTPLAPLIEVSSNSGFAMAASAA